ncbi:hypothetical protein CAEBREN_06987 [Caenorhabditis brenneri]|uniref:Uncharacterized protein n=1 Tax=Caenorhabditis brenneri TaxID=135651 RepID=G0ND05_CAEBE|nr:hypothetical protein CAEBREN_06987 [Caenorhabditis brenneri]
MCTCEVEQWMMATNDPEKMDKNASAVLLVPDRDVWMSSFWSTEPEEEQGTKKMNFKFLRLFFLTLYQFSCPSLVLEASPVIGVN